MVFPPIIFWISSCSTVWEEISFAEHIESVDEKLPGPVMDSLGGTTISLAIANDKVK